MSIVFLTGSHPRHAFVARAIARSGQLKGLVVEMRESHVPEPPDGLPAGTRDLFVRHFDRRRDSEARFFQTDFERGIADIVATPGVEVIYITRDELNGPKTWSMIDRIQPDVLLSYGVHKLGPETLALAKGHTWNIHGGLSPWYRGVTTHFWPSYLLEPQMTGMTVHDLTEVMDGGDVIHQCAAPLVAGDGVHDLACRAVTMLGEEMPELLTRTFAKNLRPPTRHKTPGRVWRESDWRPAHLHVVYDLYQDRVVDRFLDGTLEGGLPRLIRQF